MSWTTFRSAMRKDLLRLLQDPVALLMWLGIPLVIGAMITMAMGGSSGMKPTVTVLVLDHDESFVSRMLLSALGAPGADGVVQAEKVEDEESGRARLLDGQETALIVIPEGFGAALFAEEPTKLCLVTNPSQRIKPAIVEEMLEILADGAFYLHRVLGSEIEEMTGDFDEDHPPTEMDVARISVSIHHVIERIEDYLFPPVIELDVAASETEDITPSNIALLFLPGIVMMALFFAAQGMSEDVWRERSQGILRRLCATPHSVALFLIAKCAASAIVLGAISTLGIAVGILYHGLPIARLPVAAIWSTLAGTLLLGIMLLLQLVARSQRAGSILTNTVLFPLLMLGGSFFPLAVMPAWMSSVGRHTPNGWAGTVLAELLLERADWTHLLVSAAIAAAACLPLFLISARRMRAGFASGA